MATDMSEKPKVFVGDCNNRAGLRSRSQFARAMWCIDEADWPDGLRLTESPWLQPWDDENGCKLGKVFVDCYKLLYDKSSCPSSYQG